MAETKKTALIDKKQLGIDAIGFGMVTAGMMIGHIGTQLIPLENKLIKSSIVTGVGFGSFFIPIKNETAKKFIKPVMWGITAFGVISLLNAAFMGDSVTSEGQAGIAGIGNSESVQKTIRFLLPNLGDVNPVSVSNFSDQVYDIDEPNMVEDQDAELLGTEDLDMLGGADDLDNLGDMEDDLDNLSGAGMYEDNFM